MSDESPRKFIVVIVVAVLTLIQGIVYLGLSVLPFIVKVCSNNFINLGVILFFSYFREPCISYGEYVTTEAASDWSITTVEQEDLLTQGEKNISNHYKPEHPLELAVAKRTYTLALIYCVISAIWILTSILALGGACVSIKKKSAFHICFTLWIVSICIGSVLDLVTSGFHIKDIIHTQSLRSTLIYLGVRNPPADLDSKDFSSDHIYLPILLLCLSSRFVILWLVNVFGIIWSATKIRRAYLTRKKRSRITPSYNQEAKHHGGHFNDTEPVEHRRVHRSERRTFEPLKSGDAALPRPISIESSHHRQSPLKNQRVEELKAQHNEGTQTYINYQQNDGLERTVEESSVPYRFSYTQPNNRNSIASQGESEGKRHSSKVHITEELRSQLPWSYFNPGEGIAKPKHVLSHADHTDTDEQNDIMPPIPVPDYTVHYPKKERLAMRNYQTGNMSHNRN